MSALKVDGRDIIVIGTSAGGLEALDGLIGQLPAGLPASIFIVQHMAPENTGDALLDRLGRNKAFKCKIAVNATSFKAGEVYIAPADSHLLLKKAKLIVTKGARENRYRPAVDPLFRSAAVAHGPRVIGVVLTGMLDDGTAGLIAIKKCGGVTVVQDPKDAAYPDMPLSAVNNMKVDHCLPLAAMGPLLEKLTCQHPGKANSVPADIQTEAIIAERVVSDVEKVNALGVPVPYNCPNCGGVLWEMNNPDLLRYRCHTGHSFTASALLTGQNEKIEETLWVSLRMFEEHKTPLNNMTQKASGPHSKSSYLQRAKDTQVHVDRIRAMILTPGSSP